MKKLRKITALILVLVMLCMTLCSCASLDLKREEHATWSDDTSIESITLFDGQVYKKLDEKIAGCIMFDAFEWYPLYVTESDVPVLLSDMYGVYLNFSDDKNFIYGYIEDSQLPGNDSNNMTYSPFIFGGGAYYDHGYDPDLMSGEDAVYCKEELYDGIVKEYNEGVNYTHYSYEYYVFDEEYMEKAHDYNLTEEEGKIIEKILKDVKPEVNSDFAYDGYSLCSIYHLSDKEYFGQYTCEIYKYNNSYHLVKYYDQFDEYDCYEVPEKYMDDIKKIAEKAEESQEEYYAW